jgi:signal transduction histidine kinase
MSFRTKVLLTTSFTVAVSVLAVALAVSSALTRHFDEQERRRTETTLTQFQREFAEKGAQIAARVETVSGSQLIARLAAELSNPQPDLSPFVNDAQTLAREQSLEFLEVVGPDGTIISSAQWPARFGYREDWLLKSHDWNTQPVFMKREELADGPELALICVRSQQVGDKVLYVAGGKRFDAAFLESFALPVTARITLYRNLRPGFSQKMLLGYLPSHPDSVAGMIRMVQNTLQQKRQLTGTIPGVYGSARVEEGYASLPLADLDNELLSVLLIGSSRLDQVLLNRYIHQIGFAVGLAGIIVGIALSWWSSERVSRPVRELSSTVREVAGGNWAAVAPVTGHDEIGDLASAFNRMTGELVEHRERTMQAERVAAWRELARRLAHELKNPLFPLQITVENLQRARDATPGKISASEFDEIFQESTSALLAELHNLKTIIGRFSDFAKMPAPQLEQINLNAIIREVIILFDAQLQNPGGPAYQHALALDPNLPDIAADPDQIRRALKNLVLNALDAMPNGGTLKLRTCFDERHAVLEVSDTGQGLTPEECERLFTPYYTTKHHGTGLGLAIVQSVVSDHHGDISVQSQPGQGATFRVAFRRDQTVFPDQVSSPDTQRAAR